MLKQPEQILEEQLVAQLQRLGYGLVCFSLFKSLKTNRIKNLFLKNAYRIQKGVTFASTVLATLKSERTAYQGGSFAFIGFPKNSYTAHRQLLSVQKAYLGVLFFIVISNL
jgi:hypothetical protein